MVVVVVIQRTSFPTGSSFPTVKAAEQPTVEAPKWEIVLDQQRSYNKKAYQNNKSSIYPNRLNWIGTTSFIWRSLIPNSPNSIPIISFNSILSISSNQKIQILYNDWQQKDPQDKKCSQSSSGSSRISSKGIPTIIIIIISRSSDKIISSSISWNGLFRTGIYISLIPSI